ncbi:MAG: hypothetical protein OXG58_02025 [Gemmatimonadetes bacterium]|nr:hypothetical protein [Gemmatimonadota bacterium]MCY3943083.1 hypothetical protein [Gemmatimonadota bacterium]
MRTSTTMVAALAALAWLPPSTGAAAAQETTAQEWRERQALEYLRQEDTTIEGALEKLHEDRLDYGPAVGILRQVAGHGWWAKPSPRPAAELDAFADRLAEMALDATLPDYVRNNALRALRVGARVAANPTDRVDYGIPYPRAFDLLVKVYEGGYDHALSSLSLADPERAFDVLVQVYEGGYDDALPMIASADPERGPAYVRGVLERSERPPVCRWSYESERYEPPECVLGYRTFRDTPWCEAGFELYMDTVWEAERRTPSERLVSVAGERRPIPDGLPEHIEDWHRRCR